MGMGSGQRRHISPVPIPNEYEKEEMNPTIFALGTRSRLLRKFIYLSSFCCIARWKEERWRVNNETQTTECISYLPFFSVARFSSRIFLICGFNIEFFFFVICKDAENTVDNFARTTVSAPPTWLDNIWRKVKNGNRCTKKGGSRRMSLVNIFALSFLNFRLFYKKESHTNSRRINFEIFLFAKFRTKFHHIRIFRIFVFLGATRIKQKTVPLLW